MRARAQSLLRCNKFKISFSPFFCSNSDKRKLKKVVADDQLELGSGLLDDKDDYLDDDYEEDDEYYDDDYEDDYEEGSGLNLELEGKNYSE